jgi:hypothetical protein
MSQYFWCKHILWLGAALLIFGTWALLNGFIFSSNLFGWICFISITSIYIFRYLNICKKPSAVPIISGHIKQKLLNIKFKITLSFLKVFWLMPNKWNHAIKNKLAINLSCSELIQLILDSARGTEITVNDKKTILHITIH